MILEIQSETHLDMSLIDKVFAFAAEYLNIPQTAHVSLEFSDLGDVSGYCDEVDIEEEMVHLEINNNLSVYDTVITIFHEMVHCRQILTGDLVQGNPSTWKGEEYDGYYFELPWEVEAYQLESDMGEAFYA